MNSAPNQGGTSESKPKENQDILKSLRTLNPSISLTSVNNKNNHKDSESNSESPSKKSDSDWLNKWSQHGSSISFKKAPQAAAAANQNAIKGGDASESDSGDSRDSYDSRSDGSSEGKSANFRCSKCQAPFASQPEFLRHFISCTKTAAQTSDNSKKPEHKENLRNSDYSESDESDEEKEPNFRCSKCQAPFASQPEFLRHFISCNKTSANSEKPKPEAKNSIPSKSITTTTSVANLPSSISIAPRPSIPATQQKAAHSPRNSDSESSRDSSHSDNPLSSISSSVNVSQKPNQDSKNTNSYSITSKTKSLLPPSISISSRVSISSDSTNTQASSISKSSTAPPPSSEKSKSDTDNSRAQADYNKDRENFHKSASQPSLPSSISITRQNLPKEKSPACSPFSDYSQRSPSASPSPQPNLSSSQGGLSEQNSVRDSLSHQSHLQSTLNSTPAASNTTAAQPVRRNVGRKSTAKNSVVKLPCWICKIGHFQSFTQFEDHHLEHVTDKVRVNLRRLSLDEYRSTSLDPSEDSENSRGSNSNSSNLSSRDSLKLTFKISRVKKRGRGRKKRTVQIIHNEGMNEDDPDDPNEEVEQRHEEYPPQRETDMPEGNTEQNINEEGPTRVQESYSEGTHFENVPSQYNGNEITGSSATSERSSSGEQFEGFEDPNINFGPAAPCEAPSSSYQPQFESFNTNDWLQDFESGPRIAAALAGSSDAVASNDQYQNSDDPNAQYPTTANAQYANSTNNNTQYSSAGGTSAQYSSAGGTSAQYSSSAGTNAPYASSDGTNAQYSSTGGTDASYHNASANAQYPATDNVNVQYPDSGDGQYADTSRETSNSSSQDGIFSQEVLGNEHHAGAPANDQRQGSFEQLCLNDSYNQGQSEENMGHSAANSENVQDPYNQSQTSGDILSELDYLNTSGQQQLAHTGISQHSSGEVPHVNSHDPNAVAPTDASFRTLATSPVGTSPASPLRTGYTPPMHSGQTPPLSGSSSLQQMSQIGLTSQSTQETVTAPRLTIANNLMPTTTSSSLGGLMGPYGSQWAAQGSSQGYSNSYMSGPSMPTPIRGHASLPASYRPSPPPRIRGRPPLMSPRPLMRGPGRPPGILPPVLPGHSGRGGLMQNLQRMPLHGSSQRPSLSHGQKRAALSNSASPSKNLRREEITVPSRQKDNECEIIAVANSSAGLGVISNVQGSREERPARNTPVTTSESTIHLSDSITLSVRQNSTQNTTRSEKGGDAGVVANLLASRGITVTPAAGDKEGGAAPAGNERRLPSASDLNLSSAISVHPPTSRDRDGFAVPHPPSPISRTAVNNNVDRPVRPPTVDLTVDSSPAGSMGSNRLQCSQCDKTFPTQALLADHSKVHQQQQQTRMPYRCHLCTAGFSTQKGQQNHYQQFHQIHLSAGDLAIPIVDYRNPANVQRMNRLGIRAFLPLSNLQNRGAGGVLGIPILGLENVHNGQMTLQQWGITDVITLGPPKQLPAPR